MYEQFIRGSKTLPLSVGIIEYLIAGYVKDGAEKTVAYLIEGVRGDEFAVQKTVKILADNAPEGADTAELERLAETVIKSLEAVK